MRINYGIDGLRALVLLHQTRSFVQAARRLYITQPALTRRIQTLEEAVGGRLVDRTTRSVRFTALGEWLVTRAGELLEQMDQHLTEAARMARGESGRVQVACLTTVAYALAPAVVDRFHREFPQVRVTLLDDTGQRVLESVREGRAEFGIGIWHETVDGLVAQVVGSDPFVLAMPPDHPLARRRQIAWSELPGRRVVALRPTSANRRQIDLALEAAGIEPPWFDEVEHLSSLLGWLHSGQGIGVIPRLATRTAEGRQLRCVPLVRPAISRPIALVRRDKASLGGPAQLLWDLFAQALARR
jgi:DNA-binding transcriptional LysR family regulator